MVITYLSMRTQRGNFLNTCKVIKSLLIFIDFSQSILGRCITRTNPCAGEAEAGLERLHQCAEKELQVYLQAEGPSKSFNDFRTKLAGLTR